MDILLQHAVCVTPYPPSVGTFDLRIRNGVILECKSRLTPKPDDDVCDLRGRIVMPGMVCTHTHLYSSLSRGMPPPRHTPKDFSDILKKIWWKLDCALDDESIYYSALLGAIDAVMCGTTTIVDHHASPNAISGSLDIIKEAMEYVGLRGILCYEVTDRGGIRKRDEGLAENERFIRAHAAHPMFRGLVGAHASFTLGDESMTLCGQMASDLATGVHIHAAEDRSDVVDARKRCRGGLMERFSRHRLLKAGSILAHGVHLNGEEITRAREAGCTLVHNPRSNMNNRVGYAPVQLFGQQGALGTDGFPADMFAEAAFGFFKQQDAGSNAHDSKNIPPADMTALLACGQRYIGAQFGRTFGRIEKGAVADLIVLDYQAPTPMTRDNCAGHVLFGMRSSMVESVMADGRWIMRNRVVAGIDTAHVCEQSRKAAKKLWERMHG